jgi:hypothetical protein
MPLDETGFELPQETKAYPFSRARALLASRSA